MARPEHQALATSKIDRELPCAIALERMRSARMEILNTVCGSNVSKPRSKFFGAVGPEILDAYAFFRTEALKSLV